MVNAPANPAETLAMKVLVGNLIVEIASVNERFGCCDASSWTESFKKQIMADVSNAYSTGITPDENRVLVTDALSITARFCARVGYLQKTKAKAG